MKNKKDLISKLNLEIKEVNSYLEDRGKTYYEIMKWELQDDDNSIFDAGFIAGVKNAIRIIEETTKQI